MRSNLSNLQNSDLLERNEVAEDPPWKLMVMLSKANFSSLPTSDVNGSKLKDLKTERLRVNLSSSPLTYEDRNSSGSLTQAAKNTLK